MPGYIFVAETFMKKHFLVCFWVKITENKTKQKIRTYY